MKICKFFILYFSVMLPFLVAAQTNPYGEVSIASPNAASLGKYADIPVNYHTGIPQIDVPIYTIQAGPLKMPISLSYHASGIKVIETSSWVGAGWSLNAGGMITRTVMGLPDEKNTGTGAIDIYGYYTDSGYNKYLNKDFPFEDWQGFVQGRKDGEPDLFSFNVGGYSGKFFFRDDHTPILVPQQDIKIIPYFPNPGSSSIQGFTLITPDGTKYYFGNTPGFPGTVAPIEKTNPYSLESGYASGTAVSSWFLNKVVSSDGLFSINLSYTSESYGYYTLSSYPIDSYVSSATKELSLVKNIITGVRLSQISFPNGTVSFIPGSVRSDLSDITANNLDYLNTSATTLSSINISNSNGSFCKKYNLYTSYFVDNSTTQPSWLTTLGYTMQTDKKRLRLDSVQEMSCDTLLKVPAEKFTYFSEMLPRRITLGIDHWGFFNGATSNQTLIPTYSTYDGSTNTPVFGADRNSVWPTLRGGSLQQITYPTGGTTTFDFEPCDSYVNHITSMQSVGLGSSFVHLFSQAKLTDTITIISTGSPITAIVYNNTQGLFATIKIINSSNTVVYTNSSVANNNYPASTTVTISPDISLTAGTYKAILSIPSGGQPNEGASVTYSQLQNVTNSFPVTIGGLRIKTITTKTGASDPAPMVTNYAYPLGGYLYSIPVYVQHMRNDLVATYGFWDVALGFWQNATNVAGCPVGGNFYKKGGGSLRPMATFQGFHIGYPTVTVSQAGNGYSTYNYYTTNTGYSNQVYDPNNQVIDVRLLACGGTEPNYPAAPLPFDYKKGELSYEQHFNEAGKLLKIKYYYPEYDLASQQPTPGFIVTSNSLGQLLGTKYELSSPRRTKTYISETDFSQQDGGVTTDSYEYYGSSYHNQVTRKVITTSTGDSLVTNTKYSSDYHSSAWDVSPSCDVTYTNNCNACLTKYNADRTACNGNNVCITDSFLVYRRCLSDFRNKYVDCQFTNYTGAPNNNYKTQHNSSKNSANAELKPILDLQDSNRIVPIEVSDFRDNSLLKSNFTRYDYMPGNTSIPYPSKSQLLNLTNPSSTFTNSVISGSTLTKDSRYSDESSYLFLKGNPAVVTGHDGMNTIYVWDYQNSNPIAKTISAVIDTTAFTSFEADGTGNWNFATGGDSSSQVNITVNPANISNMFTTQTPVAVTDNDHQPTVGQEVGLKFTSSVAGYITGIRFYKTTGNTGTHIGELYNAAGTRLAQATFTSETATGWQTVTFSSPVTISANTTYTAAYFSSLGNYVEENDYFLGHSVTNTPLSAAADGTNGGSGADPGNGQGTFLYTASPAFPNQLYRSANYWIDVLFTSGSTPVANAGSNQTITLPTNFVSLNGSNSLGILTSYAWTKVSGPNTPTITTPSAIATTVTGLVAGTYVFRLSVNSGTSTAQITVVVNPAGTPVNIFTSGTPISTTDNDYPGNTNIQGFECGVKFASSVGGTVTGIRFYKTSGNAGTHTGEIYSSTGTRLAQATFSGETSTGWQTVTFSSPVSILANTTYIAAYHSSLGYYVEDNDYFLAHSVTNDPLFAQFDGTGGGTGTDDGTGQGLFTYSTTPAFPDQLYRSANYWVDVLFIPGSSPHASAGNDQTIALPTSATTLDGTGTTGTVSSYLWTKISGPNNPTIANPTNPTTTVSGLIPGSYVFQLSVNGGVNSSYALAGTKSYNLSGNTISKNGLTIGNKYIISYWSSGSACTIAGGTNTFTTGRSVNGWTYYEHIVTMTASVVWLSGANFIDELRLYPQGAQMISYTYKPLAGLSSMNDPNSEVTYYDYDALERLKNIKDYQGNIIKNYQYNYAALNSCGPNCVTVGMQTFAHTPTISYPVGVFSVSNQLIGNATSPAQYISLWNSNTANHAVGTLSASSDSMHFSLTLNSGQISPGSVIGCRYYQFDLDYNLFDAVRNYNAAYVDWGDGTGMKLGKDLSDSNVLRAPNTYINLYSYVPSPPVIYWNHSYSDNSLKTLTFYHNDGNETMFFDNGTGPATSLTLLRNFRGCLPQNTQIFMPTCFQQASALTVSGITNWNSITSIKTWDLRTGDLTNPCLNVSYPQDFMAKNKNLQVISTNDRGLYLEGYEDPSFKISRLKSDWNTYFTELTTLQVNDEHWNREDLTALVHLKTVGIGAGNTNHNYNSSGNPLIPIPVAVLDNVINQIAAGSGRNVSNGLLYLNSAGTNRSSASDAGFNFLKSKGWTIFINGIYY